MDKCQKIHKDQMEVIEEDKNKTSRGVKIILLYLISSLSSFLLDYFCYSLFLLTLNNLIVSNILAKLISSIYNFIVNKKVVFKSKNYLKKEILNYYLLVIFILVVNTLILKLLSSLISPYLAKIIVEISLFIISYLIQKKYIFKGSDNYKKE